MTIEEKAIAYDKAIERAKRMFSKKELNYLFPELKETGDEKVRKWLIDTIKSVPDYSIEWDVIDKSDVLAWLEKQGEQKPSDKIKPKFKVGDKIYLKPKYRMPNDDTPIANTVKEIIGIDDDFYRFKGAYIFIEDQDKYELVEQKPIDKVAPKFKVGDWITNGDYTWKIVEVKPLDYMLQSQNGNIVYDTISHVDEQFHSFTIQDAKDYCFTKMMNGEKVSSAWGKEDEEIMSGLLSFLLINTSDQWAKYGKWILSLKERMRR